MKSSKKLLDSSISYKKDSIAPTSCSYDSQDSLASPVSLGHEMAQYSLSISVGRGGPMGGPMGGGGGGGGGRGGPNDKVEAFFNVPANKCGLVIGKGEWQCRGKPFTCLLLFHFFYHSYFLVWSWKGYE